MLPKICTIPVLVNIIPVLVAHPIYTDPLTVVVHCAETTAVAITLPVFPTISLNVKINDQLLVNTFPVALNHVHDSLNQVNVANTFHHVFVYTIVAVGAILSIHETVARAIHVLPARSLNVNVKFPVLVNVY